MGWKCFFKTRPSPPESLRSTPEAHRGPSKFYDETHVQDTTFPRLKWRENGARNTKQEAPVTVCVTASTGQWQQRPWQGRNQGRGSFSTRGCTGRP